MPDKPKKDKHFSFRCRPILFDAAEKKAKEERIEVSEYLRRLIEDDLIKDGRVDPKDLRD